MVHSLQSYHPSRISFDLPELLDIQRASFNRFLKKGISNLFSEMAPIRVEQDNLILELRLDGTSYQLISPDDNPRDCILKMKTYSCKLYVKAQVVCSDSSGQILETTDEEWILVGHLPIMTKRGHFIINGSPRVIVHQVVRSPGVYFQQVLDKDENKRIRFYGDIIPFRGVWLRLQITKKGKIEAKLKKGKKVSATMLQKCLQFIERHQYSQSLRFDSKKLKNKDLEPRGTKFYGTNGFLDSDSLSHTKNKVNQQESIRQQFAFSSSNSNRFCINKNGQFVGLKGLATFAKGGRRSCLGCAQGPRRSLTLASEGQEQELRLRRVTVPKQRPTKVLEKIQKSTEIAYQRRRDLLGFTLKKRLGGMSFAAGQENKALLYTYDKLYRPVEDKEKEEISKKGGAPPQHFLFVDNRLKLKKCYKNLSSTFKERDRYNLSDLGREKINTKLGIHVFETQLTALDIKAISNWLHKLTKGEKSVDDIDHFQNRRIRTSGELLQIQFENGIDRLTKLAWNKLKEYINSKSAQKSATKSSFSQSNPNGESNLSTKLKQREIQMSRSASLAVFGGKIGFSSTLLAAEHTKALNCNGIPNKTKKFKQIELNHLGMRARNWMPGSSQKEPQQLYLNSKQIKTNKETKHKITTSQTPLLTSTAALAAFSELRSEISLKDLLSTKPINGALRELFGSNPLSQYMDQTNPLAEVTHKRRMSSLGIGGVSRESAGMAIRGIHPTHYGRICPIETPEGKNAGLVNSLAFYSKINDKGFIETPYYKVVKGQVQQELGFTFFSAKRESVSHLKIAPSDLQQSWNNKLTTNSVPVRVADNLLDLFQKIRSDNVDCIGVSPIQMISVATSLIPFLEHNDANRALMGSNMQRQAVPLMIPERPIVGTGLESLVVAESGHISQAELTGFVSYVSANKIIVESLDLLTKKVLHAHSIFGVKHKMLLGKQVFLFPKNSSSSSFRALNLPEHSSGQAAKAAAIEAQSQSFLTKMLDPLKLSLKNDKKTTKTVKKCRLTAAPKELRSDIKQDFVRHIFQPHEESQDKKRRKIPEKELNNALLCRQNKKTDTDNLNRATVKVYEKTKDQVLLKMRRGLTQQTVNPSAYGGEISVPLRWCSRRFSSFAYVDAGTECREGSTSCRQSTVRLPHLRSRIGSMTCTPTHVSNILYEQINSYSTLFQRAKVRQSLFKQFVPSVHLINNFDRSNQDTCLMQRVSTKEGDWVQKGDILTDCSASDKGELSVGKNILVAYMPWEGYNFEDAIVINERLVKEHVYTSLHIERYDFNAQDVKEGNEWFTKDLPGIPSKKVKHLDDFGLPKLGSFVQEGDILIGKMRYSNKKPTTPYERLLCDILGENNFSARDSSLYVPKGVHARVIKHKILAFFALPAVQAEQRIDPGQTSVNRQAKVRESLFQRALVNQTTFPGTDVSKTSFDGCESNLLTKSSRVQGTEFRQPESDKKVLPKIVHIFLGEKRAIQIGDKMSGRHGNKGVVATILPKQDMPYLADGTPIDIILNPLGVPSRMNVGQVFESLLGLAGTYLAQHFKMTAFDELYGVEASQSLVYLKLYQARLQSGQNWLFQVDFPGKTRLIDGRSGQCFDQWVTVGRAYILKLIHMVNEKIHARATGPYALITQQPLRGRSQKGGQRLGEMEVWALEGFGAAYTLQELLTKKSDDIVGRKEVASAILPRPFSIFDKIQLFNQKQENRLMLGQPEIFKVLICELQALCLDVGVYSLTTQSFKRSFMYKVN